jgi:hypothetical protein
VGSGDGQWLPANGTAVTFTSNAGVAPGGTASSWVTLRAGRPVAAGSVQLAVRPDKFGDTDRSDNTAVRQISITK